MTGTGSRHAAPAQSLRTRSESGGSGHLRSAHGVDGVVDEIADAAAQGATTVFSGHRGLRLTAVLEVVGCTAGKASEHVSWRAGMGGASRSEGER